MRVRYVLIPTTAHLHFNPRYGIVMLHTSIFLAKLL